MDNHRHIIGIIASPTCLMVAYQGDERLMKVYGGMKFEYCPICGWANHSLKATVIEFDDGVATRIGNRFYTGGVLYGPLL